MRILHAPQAYAPVRGGGEWHCQKVSEGLQALDHEVRVVTGNVLFPSMYHANEIRRAGKPFEVLGGVEVKRLRYGNWFSRFIPQLKTWPIPLRGKLRKWVRAGMGEQFEENLEAEIESYKPDVVMAMAHTQFNVQCMVNIRGRRKFPLVVVPLIHEHSPDCRGELMGRILRRADAIVANTPFEREWIADFFDIPIERIFVGLLGVDAPATAPEGARPKTILYFGRKDPLKGIDGLIQAFAHSLDTHPDARLVIAGARWPGSEKIDQWIEDQPEAVRARIDSYDNVSNEERERILGSARCLVLPSEEESFGLVLIEAWARNTPVIALQQNVFRCIVDAGKNGLLSPVRDPEGMAKDLNWMLEHPEEAAAMGAAGRQKCLDVYTWESVARRYQEAYEYAREHVRED